MATSMQKLVKSLLRDVKSSPNANLESVVRKRLNAEALVVTSDGGFKISVNKGYASRKDGQSAIERISRFMGKR